MDTAKIRVGVVGATGYAGLELVRILAGHRGVSLVYAAAGGERSQLIAEEFPFLRGVPELRVEAFDVERCAEVCDAVFVALPSGESGRIALGLQSRGKRVIDLSGDLRLPAAEYAAWYGKPPVVETPAVYGLTEWCRAAIRSADIVANPGCYATAALLAILPAVRAGWQRADVPIIVDAKSGVSGAGRKAAVNTLHAELAENFYAYRVGRHQHVPEVMQALGLTRPGSIVLTTQLLPIARGILAACYIPLGTEVSAAEIGDIYHDAYADEPFVLVHGAGVYPQLKHVRGSNQCHIGWHLDENAGVLQVFAAIDNLQKGAAGQAVQNFNVMYGLDEVEGLHTTALYP